MSLMRRNLLTMVHSSYQWCRQWWLHRGTSGTPEFVWKICIFCEGIHKWKVYSSPNMWMTWSRKSPSERVFWPSGAEKRNGIVELLALRSETWISRCLKLISGMDLPFCFSIDKLCFAASGHITLHRYQIQLCMVVVLCCKHQEQICIYLVMSLFCNHIRWMGHDLFIHNS
jgi:hypothetical protein